jgi:predicted RecB family nuclease
MEPNSQLFEAYLKCPTKCWLRSRGETGEGNAYAEWVRAQNESYRAEGVRRLQDTVPEGERIVAPATENLKAAKWRLAVDFVAPVSAPAGSGSVPLPQQTPGETPGQPADGTSALPPQPIPRSLESRLHAVERVASEGRGKPAQFIPIRFIFRNKLTRDDRLLLAFDALVLSELLGRDVSLGKIIHGDDRGTFKVKTAGLLGEVRKLAAKMAEEVTSASPPDLVLSRHCGECEFQNRCRQKAIEKDDLSLLANMAEKERKQLRSKGIFTVTQLSYTFRPRRRPKRLRDKKEKYHHSLKALAVREKKIHIVGTPELKIEGTPVYLDVEGLPDRDFYYLIGVRIGNGESAVQHSLWADTVADEERIWREFLEILKRVEGPILIHYGSFETTFLKRMSERYGGSVGALGSTLAKALTLNLLSFMFSQIYFPTYSNGLKEVAGYFGFKWSKGNASGAQTICWRCDWDQTGAESAKKRLVTYNANDCAALGLVCDVVSHLGSAKEGANYPKVISADDLALSTSMWPSFSSSIPAFEAINKAGRWNYQRDRIYIRSDKVVRRAVRGLVAPSSRSLYPNKEVTRNGRIVCPKCKKKGDKKSAASRILYDLRFSKRGVRTWVVRYNYRTYHCRHCHNTFGTPAEFRRKSTYGRNVLGTVVYMLIELCVTQRSISSGLNRMFRLGIQEREVHHLKEWASRFYEQTRRQLLARMLEGGLIHADETSIVLKRRRAYVWVFTTFHEVAYFYAEMREAVFLQDALKGFSGVLVSDFYAAYDSIPCPQQKCLIHLIRDLNDAVLDHPFDEELKALVVGFAGLLKGIVDTIDRRGLKHYFLKGHRRDVEQFYRGMLKNECRSEAALRCRERLEKNREKLFTFLDHDGIPWNNNNAEHAIKAFARLRRGIEGLTTSKGIEEYLILLSVCQTCKYQGLDFLDFLRSGETDIQAFAENQPRRKRPKPEQPF